MYPDPSRRVHSGAKCHETWWNNVCIRFGNAENVVSGSRWCNPILLWKTGAGVKWITSSWIATHGIFKSRSFWSRLKVLDASLKLLPSIGLQWLNQLITATLLFVQTNKQKLIINTIRDTWQIIQKFSLWLNFIFGVKVYSIFFYLQYYY